MKEITEKEKNGHRESGASFCASLKESIRRAVPKRRCCREAFSTGESGGAPAIVCPGCMQAYLCGVFCAFGNLSDPEKGYHLELDCPDEELASSVFSILEGAGIEPKRMKRGDKTALYYKDSGKIEDYLTFIGSSPAAFAVMNAKIRRELRNNANRLTNCDAANIGKTVAAAARQIECIRALEASVELDELAEEIRETARLRVELADATLDELAAAHSVPVSKSCVSHRLARLVSLAEKQ